MSDALLTLIVTDADVALARDLAATIDPVGGANMWITPLAATDAGPATHWVSSGFVPEGWQAVLPIKTYAQDADGAWVLVSETAGDPVALTQLANDAGLTVTEAEVTALCAASDVTTQDPWTAFDRLGLVLVTPPEPPPVEDPVDPPVDPDPVVPDPVDPDE